MTAPLPKTICPTCWEKWSDVIFQLQRVLRDGHVPGPPRRKRLYHAIGVNLNQNSIAPDYIMASMLKSWIPARYHAIASIVEDTYKGRVQMLDLSDGGAWMDGGGSKINGSDDITARLDELKQKIISKEIQVPSEL